MTGIGLILNDFNNCAIRATLGTNDLAWRCLGKLSEAAQPCAIRVHRLCTGSFCYCPPVDAPVFDIYPRFRSGVRVDGVLRRRWKHGPAVPLSEMRKVVLREMVVSQQFCTAVRSLWFAEVC